MTDRGDAATALRTRPRTPANSFMTACGTKHLTGIVFFRFSIHAKYSRLGVSRKRKSSTTFLRDQTIKPQCDSGRRCDRGFRLSFRPGKPRTECLHSLASERDLKMHLPHLLAERPPSFVAPHSQIASICSFVDSEQHKSGPFCGLPRLAVALLRIRCKAIFKTRSQGKRLTKFPRIDRINLRNNRFGVMGVVYSGGLAWAVRYTPNMRVTESLVRKSWRGNHKSFTRWNDRTNNFVY